MNSPLKNLEEQFHRIAQLDHASTFLGWDQMVMMPPAGMTPRAAALAEIASLRHELMTSPQMEEWIDSAESDLSAGTIPADKQAHIREMKRSWQQSVALPSRLVHAQVMAGARCEHAWRTQRGNDDWPGFLGNFREVVALAREEAQCRQALAPERFDTPYDAMLDMHCAGDSQMLIGRVFAELKQALPTLLQEVMEKQATENVKDLSGHYPIDRQKALSTALMRMLGFDFDAGRLDVSLHPFSTGVKGDLRITTRYRENDFVDSLQATAHETGHASYESGLPDELQSFPVGRARNMCIHESQSLTFEKQIFLSRAFGEALLPLMHEHLPSTSSFRSDDIWMAQTRVRPSFIRTEADEVTYPLHVMLRYEIESALINGNMEPDQIPDAWEAAIKQYLGLAIDGKHSIGCLQDIHWTDGSFGYFPSYTIGAVNAAQLVASYKAANPDWRDDFAAGNLGSIRQWMADNIWRHGSEKESQALMTEATGEGTSATHFLRHLRQRYLEDLD